MNDAENKQVIIGATPEETFSFILSLWRKISSQAVQARNRFTIALSGGNTPQLFYQYLAHSSADVPWDKTHIFLVDERHVAFEHEASNYGMLKKMLLDNINIPSDNIHPFYYYEHAYEAAIQYEEYLKVFFALSSSQKPRFDLILLGIGADGHTASLFPQSKIATETERLAIAVSIDSLRHDRLSITLPVINNAENVLFFVTGKAKASIVKNVLKRENLALPAAWVKPHAGTLFFVLDKAAEALIKAHA